MLGVAAVLCAPCTHADQYRSEVKELPGVPAEKPQEDPKQLLQKTTDPYARALLLRDLAAQAVQNQDPAAAARYLEQAIAQGALSGIAAEQMKRDLTQLYISSGDLKKALPQLEAQARGAKVPPETLVALGAAYLEMKRYKDALPLLQKGIAASAKPDPSWRRALVAAMMGAGQEKAALPLLEQLVRDDPSQREDWMRLVALHLKEGNKERAQAMLELASRLGYLASPEDRMRLVSLTSQLGVPFEAGSLMQAWMQDGSFKPSAENWRTLAGLWIAAREDGLALPALEEAIRKAPSAELYRQLAQLNMNRENYPSAARALEQALQMGAKDGATLLTLAMARYQQADVDGALQAFREAQAHPKARELAAKWVKYLESGKAREQALRAAAERQQRRYEQASLSARLLGDSVDLAAGGFERSAQLGGAGGDPLTPVGADRPGNRANSIPPWTGGLQRGEWPAAFKPGGRLVDPFPADRPLYTITAANAPEYREHLSPGHQALLARYPGYAIPVYTTRRTVSYPQAIYDASQANIGKARLLGSDALENARLGFPFPRPQSGVEIMWNHRTRYRANSVHLQSTQAVVWPSGDRRVLKQTERVYFRYGNLKDPVDIARKNILLYYLTWFGSSRNAVDFIALVHETANSIKDSRDIWVMPPQIRRMFRVPPVGYDQPFPGAEGVMFIDMVDMYNGAFDRYVWKLVGKREMILPYNAWRIGAEGVKYDTLLKPNHFNQDLTRYELHRVWVIEATEREGKRHSFGKRVFYVDEDSWNVVLVENHDRQGNLWRFQEGHLLPAYDVQSANCAPVITYDLKDGRYFANRLTAEDPPPQYDVKMNENEFLPAAVKNRYSK